MQTIKQWQKCTVCNKRGAGLCNQCQSARYCSTACQQRDLPTHKLLCKAFSEFDSSTRPSSDHIRAILFPVDERKPKLIWLPCKWVSFSSRAWHRYPDLSPFLGHDISEHPPIIYNKVWKRQMKHTLHIFQERAHRGDELKSNDSIASIIATKPCRAPNWRGPVVVHVERGLAIGWGGVKDLDMNDFRHVTDYILSYRCKPVTGVKINCVGDQKMFNTPRFEAVEIPSTDPIFHKGHTSDVAEIIGIPIFTRRCAPNPMWAYGEKAEGRGKHDPFSNQDATFLHLCCDTEAKYDPHTGKMGWGWIPKQWNSRVGSAIVVRQDGKPLSPLHVEALCKYCFDEIRPFISHSAGEHYPEEPIGKDTILHTICQPRFVAYWNKLLDEKREAGEDTDVPTPYEM